MSLAKNEANNLFKYLLNNDIEKNTENICLISNTILDSNYIKLDCSHCFNYLSLHNEIVYQKTKKLLDNYTLKFDEIKCPYCRGITNKLLPFYKYYNIKQIKGVNSPYHLTMNLNKCEFLIKKTNKRCEESACITKFGCFCNKHFKYNKEEEDILQVIDTIELGLLKKKSIKDLKIILKNNSCKLSGNKLDLINRILIQKIKNKTHWRDN